MAHIHPARERAIRGVQIPGEGRTEDAPHTGKHRQNIAEQDDEGQGDVAQGTPPYADAPSAVSSL